ncbi:MAG: hypothetical protein IPP21_19945 [Betaproteobacteria bacterium]|nr:hypothetical protein [Betaproteobacteria bacterium]
MPTLSPPPVAPRTDAGGYEPPLGPTEAIYYLLDQLYSLNFVVFAEVSGRLDAGGLERALQAVQVEQPLLRTHLAVVRGRACFKAVAPEQAALKAQVRPLRNWRAAVSAELDAPFAGEAPLGRFLWFRGRGKAVVAMVFHHTIADGKSGANLLRAVETAQALLAACRAHGTTVHGALGAAQVLALNAEFGSAQARQLGLTSLADLRGVLSGKLSASDLGLYVATITTVHGLAAKPDFWHLAADIRGQLQQVLTSGDANLVHSVYREDSLLPMGRNRARLIQSSVALAPPSSMLTNIGKVDTPDLRNGARIQSLAFLVSPPPQHPVCVTAASHGGRLHLNLLYDRVKLDDAQAQRITNTLVGFWKRPPEASLKALGIRRTMGTMRSRWGRRAVAGEGQRRLHKSRLGQ